MAQVPDYLPTNLDTKPPKGRDAYTADDLHKFALSLVAIGMLKELTDKFPGVACNLMTGGDMNKDSLIFMLSFMDQLKQCAELLEEQSGCSPKDLKPIAGIDFNSKEEDQA